MDIIDELADSDKRQRTIIVYNLPEYSGKSDSDTFAALCPSVYSSSFLSTRSLSLGKKTNKHRPLLLSLLKEEDKFELLSRSYLLCHNEGTNKGQLCTRVWHAVHFGIFKICNNESFKHGELKSSLQFSHRYN